MTQLILDPPELFTIDLLSPLKNFFTWLVSQTTIFTVNFVSFLSEDFITKLINGIKWIFDKIINLIKMAIQNIINFIKSLAPISPAEAFEKSTLLYAVFATSSVGIAGLLTALSIKVLGFGLDITPLQNLFRSFLRPELIGGIIIGTVLGVGFRTPLRYWANYIFRPSLPNWRMAYSMFVKGIISEEELNYVLAHEGGFSDRWINAIKKELTYTPSPWEVFRLADFVPLDPLWVAKKLSDVGMEEWDKQKFMEAILKRPLREETRGLISEIGNQYVYGWMSEEDTKKALLNAGVKLEELNLIMPKLILLRKRYLLQERIDIFRLQFRKDLISLSELEIRLRELGLAEENINIIIAYEKALKGIV